MGILVLSPRIGRPVPYLRLPPKVGFVNLDRRALQLQITVRQERANLIEHAPSSLVSDASLALNLLCGNPATCGTHEVHRIEPSAKRSARLLEDGSSHRGDHLAAIVARIRRSASDAMVLAFLLALCAVGNSARESLLFQVLQARIIIGNRLAKSCKVNRSGLGMCCLTFILASSQHNSTKKAYLMSRDTYHPVYHELG